MSDTDFYLAQNSLRAGHTMSFGISSAMSRSNDSLTKEKRWESFSHGPDWTSVALQLELGADEVLALFLF